jgi:hypothetical protein
MSLTVEVPGRSFVALSGLDVTDKPLGTTVTDAVSGGEFTLAASSASINHTTVETVSGHPELRWLLQTVAPVVPGNLPASLFKGFCSQGADASGGATHIAAVGVKVGDSVAYVLDITDHSSVAADFESTVTVADQIQQTSVNLSAKTLVILVIAQS